MRTSNFLLSAVAIGILAGASLTAGAAEPAAAPPPPNTLWRFLGIPQGCQKIKDATINARGNHPNRERKPPLKRIGDPANLESPNPAIKAAANIKTEEDLAPQKIKAIKYLATIGCGCYPGVREALLAALDDCTEEVRLEAAIAFCEAAGNPCAVCNNSGCCNAAVMTKLREMAYGTDAQGCPKESSARVRAAAENALNACRRVVPAAEQPQVPEKKEVPLEEPGRKETPTPAVPGTPPPPEVPEPTPGPAPTSGFAPGQGPTARSASVFGAAAQQVWIGGDRADGTRQLPAGGETTPTIVNPLSFAQLGQGSQPQSDPSGGQTVARYPSGGCVDPYCPQRGRVPCVRPGEAGAPSAPGAAAPGEAAPGAAPGEAAAPPAGALAGTFGAVSGPSGVAPNMIGDFFGGGQTWGPVFETATAENATVAIAGGDRRMKICEDTSPLPQNRVYVNFSHFQNPLVDAQGRSRNLGRYTFGVEKTFFSQNCSLDLRIPVASALNARQSTAEGAELMGTELGNIPLTFKGLLHRGPCMSVAGGVGMIFPTGRDASLDVDGLTVLVRNDAFHFQPFLGWLWTPNDCWFAEGFMQADFDTNGNKVFDGRTGGPLTQIGVLQEQSLLYLDFAIGRWLYNNPCGHLLTGIAPVVEFHYTTTMQDADFVWGIGNQSNRVDVLNITGGLHFQLGPRSTWTVAGVAPLRTGDNKLFDAEARVQFDRRF